MRALEYRKKDNVRIDFSLHNENRSAKAFRTKKEERRYWILLISLTALGLLFSYGLLVYNNPVPVDSPSFIPVVQRRIVAVVAMFIAAICHSLSTVAFQSITNNRIITPSLLGFESLYSTIHTSTMFLFGASALVSFSGIGPFFLQVSLMVLLSLILYGWLLSGKYGDLQLVLLIGIIIGTGLSTLSAFMRKLLSPSEFDLLQTRLIGSVNNADAEYFPIVIPMVIIIALLLFIFSKKLNILSLGKDVSTTFGIKYQPSIIYTLVLVTVLMSISTALVGPLTFFGFLVAILSYQAAPTYDHRYIFPMALAIGFFVLTSAYFLMYHVFNSQAVSVFIELFGGIVFLIVILRKRSL
ncbi:iron chelate uptake ABC transporter family permease subunit [Psychrobacillus psychrodurans]|uniref:iron chelate uptake ABC transporter family permease subunit n=1 Tax=Psychrobacillus psychrodurans TaxID=126157 RepID=UPI0008E2203E|nr:iron chelate uptake ABC transporter family permease subunit [Psychrobacillus psychrodurans]MCZ8541403.1 iron chelate uptake ABC transporter family permease subunit [Psychrobacillus psychrodurans]SFM97987.1 iron complex transport system permease protein [Psychrobacillus psychrodurans]